MDRLKQVLVSKEIYLLARIALGIVFIISGAIKMADLDSFSKVVRAFALLPSEYCYLFALILSVCEIVSGLGLCFGIKGSLHAIILMLTTFVGVLSYALLMGYDIDCGCFGSGDPEAAFFSGLRAALVRDLSFIALVIYLYFWQKKNSRVEI